MDSQEKFDQLARGIVGNRSSPDVVPLEEFQGNNGADGVGDGAAGGPRYE